MAELKTAVSMIDGITPVIKHMSNAMNIIINTFASMEQASSHAIDVNAINAARRELEQAGARIQNVEQNIQDAANRQNNLNRNLQQGTSAASGLASQIRSMVSAYVGWQSVSKLINLSDTYADTTSRLQLMLREGESFAEVQKMVRDSAKETFSNYKMTVDTVGKMGIQAGKAFSSTQDVVNFVGQLNKHLAISGTSTAAAEGAMIQLTQAMANGVLRGEELNSVLDGMPTVAATIEKYFNKNGDNRALKKIAEDGLITADIVKAALYGAADETNKAFNGMNFTFRDIWNRFVTYADEAMTPVYQKLVSLTNSEKFHALAASAGQAFSSLAAILVTTFDVMGTIASVVTDNWDFIAPIISTVAGAFIAYNAALLYNNTLQAISAIRTAANAALTAFLNARIMLATGATFAQTAAQWGLNAALLACPITWIVAGIIAIIGIIYLAVAAVNRFAGTSYSATGFIAGVFTALGATIYNMVAYIWNAFAAFAEFLFTVLVDPVTACKRLAYNLAINFLDVCISMSSGWDKFATSMANAFISAINVVIGAWNKLVDFLPDKVKGALGIGKGTEIKATTSITSNLQGYKKSLEGMLAKSVPEGFKAIPRMEMKNVGGAYQAGYNKGANIFGGDKTEPEAIAQKTAAEMIAEANKGTNALGGANNKVAKAADKTAKNTDKMVDQLYGTDEQLAYLRDIAERDAINKFTTAEIKVDMTNNNTVNSELDLDGIGNMLADKLFNTMSAVAEGVHA